MVYAGLRDEAKAAAVRAELRDHLMEKAEDLRAGGMAVEDAVFKAVEDHGDARVVGYGLRPKFRWLDVRTQGTARGVIAVGPRAVGVVACGGATLGVVSIGGASMGVVSMGGVVMGLLYAWAGVGFAPLGIAYAAVAIGLFAMGGIAVGVVAMGAMAFGVWGHGDVTYILYDNWNHAPAIIQGWFNQPYGGYAIGLMVFLPLIMMGALFLIFFFCQCLMWRERRRIRRADPTLAA